MLAALACVDYVVIFDDASVAGLVERVLPNVLVKGGQYSLDQVVGHQAVLRHGGQVICVPMKSDYSTSAMIEKLLGKPSLRRSAA
jgi:D-beta-D-heptose 7-phosphate kinase/D-beta-D-heptose 1-phosphate adenosyltransferase